MHIIVVGAGIAGLSLALALARSGHHVEVLESAPQLAEIGAGVQITPQAVKYFFQWGLRDDIMAECIIPEKMWFRDWKNGSVIGEMQMHGMEEEYGAPYIVVHRAVLHAILHRHAVRAGAEIHLDSRVVEYDFENGAVQLKNGKRTEADLVIAADGINSFARSQLLQSSDPKPQPTGWAAFRMMAEVSKIKANPATAHLADLDSNNSGFWTAPDVSFLTYLIKDATMLNIVIPHRDTVDTTGWTYQQHKDTVKSLLAEFEQPVQELLDLSLPNIVNYPVFAVPPLPNWVHSSGRFTLLGDAAHAMTFFLAMGVSVAVEDAVSLAAVLDLAGSDSTAATKDAELKKALSVFQEVRRRRANAVQRASLRAGESQHVSDDKEREALYELLSHSNEVFEGYPGFLEKADDVDGEQDDIARSIGGVMNKKLRNWCFAYDAVADITNTYNSREE